MTYATATDISTRYGDELLKLVADRDVDGVVDTDAVAAAAADVDERIDLYLSEAYTLPLDPVPGVLTGIAVDMMVYRLAADADVATDQMRARHKDAILLLEKIAKGEISIGVGSYDEQIGGRAVLKSAARVYGRGAGKARLL